MRTPVHGMTGRDSALDAAQCRRRRNAGSGMPEGNAVIGQAADLCSCIANCVRMKSRALGSMEGMDGESGIKGSCHI